MGAPKAALPWHGSTLLRRVTGIVGRSVDGPVVVVRAPGQELPELEPAVEVVADAREDRGPLQGLAAGLAAIGQRAVVAYVSCTDVPLLHPAFVRCVVAALDEQADVVLPEIGGHHQPLAAAYRLDLLGLVHELIAVDRLAPALLLQRCRVLRLSDETLLRDRPLARLDPKLDSLTDLDQRADYDRAHALPAPEIEVRCGAALASRSHSGQHTVRAWTLGGAAAAIGLGLDEHVVATLNGQPVARDPQLPLAAGDTVGLMVADGPPSRPRAER